MSSASSASPAPSSGPPPFLLIPADRSRRSPHHTSAFANPPPPSQSLPHPTSSSLSQPLAFKAPAHAHAAHLHSIPPRSSSTRSIIIDRTLAAHTAYRLAAAQADLAGGVFPLADANNSRHEHEFFRNFVLEEGLEDLAPLADTSASGSYGLPPTQARVPNATLATRLDATAQGHANVLCAMLMQPPTPHHIPAHPHHHTSHTHHQHHNEPPVPKLPTKVRARLALAVLAEQYFVPPAASSPTSPVGEIPEIPTELAPFVALSSFRPSSSSGHPTLPGIKSFLSSSTSNAEPSPTSSGPSQSPFQSFSAPGVSSQRQKPVFFGSPAPSPVSPSAARPKANTLPSFSEKERDRDVSRAAPFSPSSPTSHTRSRAPSTPYTLMMPRPSSNLPSDKASPIPPLPKSMTTNWTNSPTALFNGFPDKSPSSTTSTTSPFASSSATSVYSLFTTPLPTNRRCARHLRTTCTSHVCSSPPRSDRSTIGAGLDKGSLSSLFLASSSVVQNVHLKALTHFLLFSAFVFTHQHAEGLDREWYALLAMMIERAVLEGYLRCGWRGGRAGEVLFGLGGGGSSSAASAQDTANEEDDEEEEEFVPDNWPLLQEAVGSLFSAERKASKECKEFLGEMRRRRDEFFAPARNTTLAQHLDSLNSGEYAAEILTRYMTRFIYAVESSFSDDLNGKKHLRRYFNIPPSVSSSRSSSRGTTPSAVTIPRNISAVTHEPPTPISPGGGYKRVRSTSNDSTEGQPDRKRV